jgi:AraC-like DNA-binding protein
VLSPIAAPRPRLARFVEDIRVVLPAPDGAPRPVEYLPDGTSSLVFRWLGPGTCDAGVRGPCTTAQYKTVPGLPLAVRVVFRPGGAYPFFGVPLDRLADRITALGDLWGSAAATLLDRVDAAHGDGRAAASVIERALWERLRHEPYEPAAAVPARAAAARVAAGETSVGTIARDLGVSERHLRRAFRATVGVGPKTFARIVRFQRAIALRRSTGAGWGEVAGATGYFDQAHLVGDLTRFLGAPPSRAARLAHLARRQCGA